MICRSMSTLDGPPLFGSDSGDGAEEDSATLDRLTGNALARGFERAAFWTAVALPFLYVPLLVGGVSTSGEFLALVTLLGLHFVALYLGQDYDPD